LTDRYDVIVIGAGTGGYPAAMRAAQLGMKVACIERRSTLGGTCLNVGCIPSKAMLQSTNLLAEARSGFEEHGIEIGDVSLKLDKMLARKSDVVEKLTKGVQYLLKKNGVERIEGSAKFEANDTVRVDLAAGGTQLLTAKRAIIIATGSEVAGLPGVDIDEERILSSTGALELQEVPEHLVVVGAGYIGLELGSVWRRLGAKVTVIEYAEGIVPSMDREIAREFEKLLRQQGLEFRFGTKVTGAERARKKVKISCETVDGGDVDQITADALLVSIGRQAYTAGLGLDVVGVELDERGRIPVGPRFETNVANIFAVGDVIPGPMLAHKSTLDGVRCAEGLAGQYPGVDYNTVPSVIYTSPEVASVGKTEEKLQAQGIAYKSGTFPFSANSRARCNGDTRGLTKILADANSDRLLGIHIVGPEAGSIIHEAVVAMEFGGSSEDLALTVHAHPTLPESIKEAALVLLGQGMHI
jgi:dihydrolipoamide dehydrogenase